MARLDPARLMTSSTAAVVSFSLAGLRRSRLHQFLFLTILASGFAMLVFQITDVLRARWSGSAAIMADTDIVHAALGAPLLLGLCGVAALRAAFLIPLDLPANWIFRLAEDPRTRAQLLNGVMLALSFTAVVPPLAIGLALQPGVLGYRTAVCLPLTMLANLCLVESALLSWRRIPFTCSYLPGKMHLGVLLTVIAGCYLGFVVAGAQILRFATLQMPGTLLITGLLISTFSALRRRRIQSWGDEPLEFDDEDPGAVRVLGLTINS